MKLPLFLHAVHVGVLVLTVMCSSAEAVENTCWWRIPDREKSICSNVERSLNERDVSYFMGDILHHLLDSNDSFLQISEKSNSASFLSKCADRFCDNLSLRRSQLPAYSWPDMNKKMSSRTLPKAKYYYAHITDVKLMPKRFEFLDTVLKRSGYSSFLLLDYNLEIPGHRDMSQQMIDGYGGELHRVCHSNSSTINNFGLGIFKIGKDSMIAVTDHNRFRAPKVSIQNRKKSLSGKTRKHRLRDQRFPSSGYRKYNNKIPSGDDDARVSSEDDD